MSAYKKSPAVVRHWKRGLAVGCSHGYYADKVSLKNVLKFAERWKPDTVAHLGDFWDLEAFREGANGQSDHTPDADITAGEEFLTDLCSMSYATRKIIFKGNHEARLHRLAKSPNELVAMAANQGIGAINDLCKKLKADLVEYDNIIGWRQLGDWILGHGYMFNETFIRDHAETYGNCIIAHGHKAGQVTGRRSDNPTCICVGTLAQIPNMAYASTKRARHSWSQGLSFFEYCDNKTVAWLIEGPHGETVFDEHGVPRYARSGEWRFPL